VPLADEADTILQAKLFDLTLERSAIPSVPDHDDHSVHAFQDPP